MKNTDFLRTTVLPQFNCSNCSHFKYDNPEKLKTKEIGYYVVECMNVVHPLQDCILRGFEAHSEQPSLKQTLNKETNTIKLQNDNKLKNYFKALFIGFCWAMIFLILITFVLLMGGKTL